MKRFLLIILIGITVIVDISTVDVIRSGESSATLKQYFTLVISIFLIGFSLYLLWKDYRGLISKKTS